jgi:hypothetical protein
VAPSGKCPFLNHPVNPVRSCYTVRSGNPGCKRQDPPPQTAGSQPPAWRLPCRLRIANRIASASLSFPESGYNHWCRCPWACLQLVAVQKDPSRLGNRLPFVGSGPCLRLPLAPGSSSAPLPSAHGSGHHGPPRTCNSEIHTMPGATRARGPGLNRALAPADVRVYCPFRVAFYRSSGTALPSQSIAPEGSVLSGP